MNCVLAAWDSHEAELRYWLRKRLGNPDDAEDLLQELFLKAMRQGKRFCEIDNARAWLFQVARNALADRLRLAKEFVEVPRDLTADSQGLDPVDSMAACLPAVLVNLSEDDREILEHCDINGMKQQDFAISHGLTLSATKSRLLRARKRLRERLIASCGVRFSETGQICCYQPDNCTSD